MNTTLNHKQIRFFRSELQRDHERFAAGDARQEPYARALGRIDDGSYGTCLDCGNGIHVDRLLAIPETPYCITCGSRKVA